MKRNRSRDIGKVLAEGTLIDAALAQAAWEAVRRHKQAGHPVVAWQDGKIVRVPPEAIKLPGVRANGKARIRKSRPSR